MNVCPLWVLYVVQVEVCATGRSLVHRSPTNSARVRACLCHWVWPGATITFYTKTELTEEVRRRNPSRKYVTKDLYFSLRFFATNSSVRIHYLPYPLVLTKIPSCRVRSSTNQTASPSPAATTTNQSAEVIN
jgi:hypothetical protein